MHIKKNFMSFSNTQITKINNINNVSFLENNNVMDCSLLLIIIEISFNKKGIHEVISVLETIYLRGNIYKSNYNKYIYIIGFELFTNM